MDTVTISGVPLLIYSAGRLQGRWTVDNIGRFGALMIVVERIIEGERPGWVEGIRNRLDQRKSPEFVACYNSFEDMSDNLLRWSSFGGCPEADDFCLVGVAAPGVGKWMAIARSALIELIGVLLERSGLDPTKSPPPLPPFDPKAPYMLLPMPPPAQPKPPTPLRENVELMRELNGRINELGRTRDPKSAYEQRKQLLADMREMGFFREDLIASEDIDEAISLWAFLTSFEELRKYYRSAYRKTVFGSEPAPNVIGGPISHKFFRTCRLWYPNAKERSLDDYRDSRNKIIVADDDQHPHEVLAILETEMRRLSDLSGDFGERRVEHDTFKALFRWEREDGVHASLTFASVESW